MSAGVAQLEQLPCNQTRVQKKGSESKLFARRGGMLSARFSARREACQETSLSARRETRRSARRKTRYPRARRRAILHAVRHAIIRVVKCAVLCAVRRAVLRAWKCVACARDTRRMRVACARGESAACTRRARPPVRVFAIGERRFAVGVIRPGPRSKAHESETRRFKSQARADAITYFCRKFLESKIIDEDMRYFSP